MAKIRIKEIKQQLGGEDITAIFEEMTGVRDAAPDIIRPKFVKIRNIVMHVYKILKQFGNFPALHQSFPEYKSSFVEICSFCDDLKTSIVFDESKPTETEDMYNNLSKPEMNLLYNKIKNNEFIQQLIIQCAKLKRYKVYIENEETLRDNFVGLEPGLSLTIFNFSTLDLKKMWVHHNFNNSIKKYILSILHLLWKDLYKLYEIHTSANVDIDKFTSILIKSVNKLKSTPKLSRCHNAFRRIENSVSLLKGNFNNYYRESVASKNPNMIMESFIIDVGNQGTANPRLTKEFRDIIRFMREMGNKSGKNTNPQIQKLFGVLEKNFKVMEGKTGIAEDKEPLVEEKKDLDAADISVSAPPIPLRVYKPSSSSRVVRKRGGRKSKKKKKKVVRSTSEEINVEDNIISELEEANNTLEETVDNSVDTTILLTNSTNSTNDETILLTNSTNDETNSTTSSEDVYEIESDDEVFAAESS